MLTTWQSALDYIYSLTNFETRPPGTALTFELDRARRLLGALHCLVEPRGVDHRHVGAIALAERARREPHEARDLRGEPLHRALHRHERAPRELGVAHPLEEAEREVVVGHVA